MARIGMNPARGKMTTYRPSNVTVGILTYIPHLEGYFHDRLKILQLVLNSLVAHTKAPFDLLVFDNGSCEQVVSFLRKLSAAKTIDYLLLSSRNIGKIGAFKLMFHAAPGEIIAYADDDILFYPGWLTAQLHVLNHFPQVGMVSGVPVRNAATYARNSLDHLIQEGTPGLEVSLEQRIPEAWESDWALSTGRDPGVHQEALHERLDTVLRLGEVEAIGGANHFQFVARKDLLLQVLPSEWSGKLMGHMVELDEAIDAMGYLRLSTVDRYTRHLGNTLSQSVLQEMKSFNLEASQFRAKPKASKHWILQIPGGGRVLRAVYHRLFNILHEAG